MVLLYRLPPARTSGPKVALWRKLKSLGVFSPQGSVAILPYSERTLEQLEWIAAEIRELSGDASVWEARTLTPAQERRMKEHFLEQVNGPYRRFIEEAAQAKSTDAVRKIWAQYQRVREQDYLHSPLSREVAAACERRVTELGKEKEP